MPAARQGAYGPDRDIVDHILGITFEIWEERQVDLIHQYYGEDCIVWGLDGITHGAQEVVDATRATLAAFPDRRLIAEDVIWSGSRGEGYYTSHRLLSTATNRGPTAFGPATGKAIRMTNIADCVIEDGVITREWLIRDNMMFARQLGADPVEAARAMRSGRSAEHQAWLDNERERVLTCQPPQWVAGTPSPHTDPVAFSWYALGACWSGDKIAIDEAYAPYCVAHRSPFDHYSGRQAIHAYYRSMVQSLGAPTVCVDHVASQPVASNGTDIAVRWSVAGAHDGELMGTKPTGQPVYILGVTHWRCVADRIVKEKTVFDDLAVLSQVVDAR